MRSSKATNGAKRIDRRSKPKPDITLTVTEESALLAFLLERLTGKSRNNIKSLLTHKEVLVDGVIVTKHDHPLRPGQQVVVKAKNPYQEMKSKVKLDIIYEDDELIAINKPAGLLSIATSKERERTAYHMLMTYVQRTDPQARVYVVHRLDRDTSGVLIIAKNEQIKHALQDNWDEIVQKRSYIAVVEGRPSKRRDTIRSWLLETRTHLMYSSSTPGDGQEAITDYRVLRQGLSYALLEVNLHTGRKNQIRVHMKDMGHSIAGDKKYGAKSDPLKRLCLHADLLELTHPLTGAPMRFEAKPPGSFAGLLSQPMKTK